MPSTGPMTGPMKTSGSGSADRPRLAAHVRLAYDQARQRHVLLTPETVTVLNGTGAAILQLCDGERTVGEILAELRRRYGHVAHDEVWLFLRGLLARGCVEAGRG